MKSPSEQRGESPGPIRNLLMLGGAVLLVQLVLASFGMPKFLTDWLTCRKMVATKPVGCIVVMGGGGIPSRTGLIRTYYAAEFALRNPAAKIIVALPSAGLSTTDSAGRMRDELILRGVAANRILLEPEGRNTAEQATRIRGLLGDVAQTQTVMVVTSPLHLRRSVLCLRKAGFISVQPMAAADTTAEGDMGGGLSFRYGFWNNWISQIEVAREFAAIVWYRFKGRI